MELLAVALGGGISAAVVSGAVQIILWRLNRKATVDDRKGDGDKEIRDALQLLFYDKIKYLGRKYVAAKSISFEELEDLDIFHKFYKKSLNGNGTLDGLMGLVHGLQVRT